MYGGGRQKKKNAFYILHKRISFSGLGSGARKVRQCPKKGCGSLSRLLCSLCAMRKCSTFLGNLSLIRYSISVPSLLLLLLHIPMHPVIPSQPLLLLSSLLSSSSPPFPNSYTILLAPKETEASTPEFCSHPSFVAKFD